jgi:hypothetical protein
MECHPEDGHDVTGARRASRRRSETGVVAVDAGRRRTCQPSSPRLRSAETGDWVDRQQGGDPRRDRPGRDVAPLAS